VPVLTCIKAVEAGIGQAVVRLLWSGTLIDDSLKSKILELLDQHRIMTLATNRPDGWPQATTVAYVKGYRCASVPNLLANRNPGQGDRGLCPYSMVAISGNASSPLGDKGDAISECQDLL
jgi:hypothetical protein